MGEVHYLNDELDFGVLPPEIDMLLKRGAMAHPRQPDLAEADFLAALEQMPSALPAYRCLVKHYNRMRRFDEAYAMVVRWIAEAARQANLDDDWRQWQTAPFAALSPLKAYAFIQLRRGESAVAAEAVSHLMRLDPSDGLGGSVVAALLTGQLDVGD